MTLKKQTIINKLNTANNVADCQSPTTERTDKEAKLPITLEQVQKRINQYDTI